MEGTSTPGVSTEARDRRPPSPVALDFEEAMNIDIQSATVDVVMLMETTRRQVHAGAEVDEAESLKVMEFQSYVCELQEEMISMDVFEIQEVYAAEDMPPGAKNDAYRGVLAEHVCSYPDWVLTNRGSEISIKQLSTTEREEFDAADAKEWGTIVSTGAVEVLCPSEANVIRRGTP